MQIYQQTNTDQQNAAWCEKILVWTVLHKSPYVTDLFCPQNVAYIWLM